MTATQRWPSLDRVVKLDDWITYSRKMCGEDSEYYKSMKSATRYENNSALCKRTCETSFGSCKETAKSVDIRVREFLQNVQKNSGLTLVIAHGGILTSLARILHAGDLKFYNLAVLFIDRKENLYVREADIREKSRPPVGMLSSFEVTELPNAEGIVVVRHGLSINNQLKKNPGSYIIQKSAELRHPEIFEMSKDSLLAPEGREAAAQLGTLLMKNEFKTARISPMRRCLETFLFMMKFAPNRVSTLELEPLIQEQRKSSSDDLIPPDEWTRWISETLETGMQLNPSGMQLNPSIIRSDNEACAQVRTPSVGFPFEKRGSRFNLQFKKRNLHIVYDQQSVPGLAWYEGEKCRGAVFQHSDPLVSDVEYTAPWVKFKLGRGGDAMKTEARMSPDYFEKFKAKGQQLIEGARTTTTRNPPPLSDTEAGSHQ